MSSYSLDSIRTAAEVKYGSTDIDLADGMTVRLLNPLRLSKTKRDRLMSIQAELDVDAADAASVDQADVFSRALQVVAETPAQAAALLDAIGDDLAVLAQVFETYGQATQVGEASASAS